MGRQDHIFRPADLRKSVTEWVANGFTVTVTPDGEITVKPPTDTPQDAVDLIDWRKKK